jgi:hypothetical protein
MLLRLTPQSKQASDQMAALGLHFYDAQGRFIGIAQVADQLQKALGGLTAEQRNSTLATIFGTDAIRGASLLYSAGAKGVQEYVDAVNDQGAAQRVAAKQLDNLKGDFLQFTGSLETLQINLGNSADSGLRSIVQAGTKTVNALGEVVESPVFDRITSRIGHTLGGVAHDVKEAGDALSHAFSSVDTHGIDSLFDKISGLAGPLAGLAAAGGAGVLGHIPLLNSLAPSISPLTGVLIGVVAQSKEARQALGDFFSDALGLARQAGPGFLDSLKSLADPLGHIAADAIHLADDALPLLGAAFGIAGAGAHVVSPILEALADALGFVADESYLAIPALTAFAAAKWSDQITKGVGLVTSAASALKGFAGDVSFAYKTISRTEGISKISALGTALRSTSDDAGGLAGVLGRAGLSGSVLGVTGAIAGGLYIYSQWRDNVDSTRERIESLTKALQDNMDANALNTIARQINDLLDKPENKGLQQTFDAAGLSVKNLSQILNQSGGEFAALSDRFDNFKDLGTDVDQLRAGLSSVPAGIRPFVSGLLDMQKNGKLTAEQVALLLRSLGELDTGAQAFAGGLKFQAQQFAAAAKGADLSATAQKKLDLVLSDRGPIEQRRAALQYLIDHYPKLAAAAGIAGAAEKDAASKAGDAKDQAKGLADALGLVQDGADGAAGSVSNFGDATKDALSSALGLTSAYRSLDSANLRVADARRKLQDILSGNTEGVKSARDALRTAEQSLADAVKENADKAADALDSLADAKDRLAEAEKKVGLTEASSLGQYGGKNNPELSDAYRDLDKAKRDVEKQRRETEQILAGQTDSVVNARKQVADAQKKLADELAKTGPKSREAADAQRDLDDAQAAVYDSAVNVSKALGDLSQSDIPSAIAEVKKLGDQHLLTKDQVDALNRSLLFEAALLGSMPSATPTGGGAVPGAVVGGRPSPNPATGRGITPGFGNADRENASAAAQAFAPAPTAADFLRQVSAALSRNYPNPTLGEQAVVFGIRFVWTNGGWVRVSNLQGARPGQINAGFADGGILDRSGVHRFAHGGVLSAAIGLSRTHGHDGASIAAAFSPPTGGVVAAAPGLFPTDPGIVPTVGPAGLTKDTPQGRIRAFEPEAGPWEGYIPGAPAKRPQAIRVWSEIGRRLGMLADVAPMPRGVDRLAFADGGIRGSVGTIAAPAPPSASGSDRELAAAIRSLEQRMAGVETELAIWNARPAEQTINGGLNQHFPPGTAPDPLAEARKIAAVTWQPRGGGA